MTAPTTRVISAMSGNRYNTTDVLDMLNEPLREDSADDLDISFDSGDEERYVFTEYICKQKGIIITIII